MPQDRPDLVTRVFKAKLEGLKTRLLDYDILGKVRAYVYVVEFQEGFTTCPLLADHAEEVQANMPRAV
jgi:hypothetical protein